MNNKTIEELTKVTAITLASISLKANLNKFIDELAIQLKEITKENSDKINPYFITEYYAISLKLLSEEMQRTNKQLK